MGDAYKGARKEGMCMNKSVPGNMRPAFCIKPLERPI